MPSDLPFVPVEAAERRRKNLRPNLADCRRIREVWLERQRTNQAPDAGHRSSAAWGYALELRAIAEEEAGLAIELLGRAAVAMRTAIPIVKEYRDRIVDSETVDGDLATLDEDTRVEVATHDGVVALMEEINAAVDAANQE